MKNKALIVSILLLIVLTVTGCEKKDNKVYAYYDDLKSYGETKNKLEDYKKSYKELKDENGKQRKYFLGHILDKDGKIERGFVCGIENDKPFCIEGKNDKETYEENKKILLDTYGKKKCKEEKYDNVSFMKCSGKLDVSISSNGNGYIGISKSGQCYVRSDNSMYCY